MKSIILLVIFIFIFSIANAIATTSEILIIHSYHQGFAWTDKIQQGIESKLNKDLNHNVHVEYLDSKRNNYDGLYDLFHTMIMKKYKDVDFDIVIVSDNNALEFVLAHRDLGHIYDHTPIIFCGVNASMEKIDYFKKQDNITGVYENFSIKETVVVIKQLQPDTVNVAIVADVRLKDKSIIDKIKTVDDVKITWIHDWTIKSLKDQIKSLPNNSALIKYLFHKSNNGELITLVEATELVYTIRPDISMYTVCDFEVGGKIIGGYVINGFEQGRIAAEMAEQILDGVAIDKIKSIYDSPNTPMFDYLLLKKYDIDLDLVPKNSILLNVPLSLYDKYKSYFWPIVLAAIIQFFILMGFIAQRIARLKAERLQKFTKFAVDNVKDAAFWINSSGRFIYVNQKSCSRLGYTHQELLKMNMWEIHFNDFGKKDWENHFREMRTKGWAIIEHTHKTKDGNRVPVEVSATYVKFGKEEYVVAFARDITDRIKQIKDLEISENRYRSIYESTMVGMFQMNGITGKMITVNPAHAYILGYDSIEEVIEDFGGWKSYTDKNQIESGMRYLKETGKIDNFPVIGTKKDKTLVDLEVSASYNKEDNIINGVILDVTDRKLAERALIDSSKKYRILVETIPYGVEEIDVNGRFVYVNDAYLKMMRVKKTDVLGHYVWEFVSSETKDNLKELFRNLPIDQPVPTTYEGRNITKGGRGFDVKVDWEYKKDKADNVIGFVGIVSDISNVVRYRKRQELASEVLDILNSEFEAELTIKKILTLIKRFTVLDAVAIRLQEDDDYPYYVTEGFDQDFVQKETHICSRTEVGDIIRNANGIACLDCMCGMIISGDVDNNLPFFTSGGSFWSNNTEDLLSDNSIPKGVRIKTRNRCNAEGYRSVALIPLVSSDGNNIGLLQLNDRRKNMFTFDMIEFFEGLGASIGIALGRKQSEDLIRESEERYRTLFETAPLAIIFWDGHTHIQEWNNHSEQIFGWPKEEAIGRNLFDFLIPKHERTRLLDVVESLLNKTLPSHVINDNLTKSGDTITCEWNNTILYDDKGELKGVISLGQDITERVKTENDLKTAAQIFRTVPSGIFIYQCENSEMILIDGNPAAELITGININDNRNKLFDEVWSDGADLKQALYNSCILKNDPYENEAYIYHSDDLDGVYRVKGFCLPGNRIAVAFEDITQSYKATKALEESEEKFRLTFTTSPDPMNLLKVHPRVVVDINKGFEREYGYSRDEIIGSDISELNMWTNSEERDKFYDVLLNQGYIDSAETTLQDKDGIPKTALVSSRIIKINNEDHILSMIKDISGIKKVQETLLEKERQLRRVSKMEAVGTLAGGVAHDFNNIIQIISGNLQLLMMNIDDESVKSQLDAMYTASMRGSNLARRLLTFSRRVESQLQAVDVNEEIRLAYKLLERAATGPVMVNMDLRLYEDLPLGLADPTQLNQVITNLCINAKDAMPNGGDIIISSDLVELDSYYCEKHPDASPGVYIKICISDSGEGMTQEVQERIFEPFFTTKDPSKGTGLGLSVVYGIMQSHGGYVTVYSIPNQGTEFKLYIPISNGEVEKKKSIELNKDLIGGNETILMIDDEEDIKKVGKKLLEMYGYTLLSASDGTSGLKIYHDNKDDIDLIILDLIMPDISGTEVLKEILLKEPKTKIIVVSGYSTDGPVKDAIGSGAKSFINKPYTLRELIKEVRKVIDEEE